MIFSVMHFFFFFLSAKQSLQLCAGIPDTELFSANSWELSRVNNQYNHTGLYLFHWDRWLLESLLNKAVLLWWCAKNQILCSVHRAARREVLALWKLIPERLVFHSEHTLIICQLCIELWMFFITSNVQSCDHQAVMWSIVSSISI